MTASFVCEKGHVFIYPSKQTKFRTVNTVPVETIENHVCPHCHTLNISEAPEDTITSVKSVDLSEVDGYLKEGYVVKELYSKTATLVKLAVPRIEQPDPDCNEAVIEANETVNPELEGHDISFEESS